MELWSMMSTADTALMLVSLFVIFAGVLGILSSLLTTLESRSREIAILRALGARPFAIVGLFLSEGLLLAIGAYALGFVLVYPCLYGLQPMLLQHYGFHLPIELNTRYDGFLFLAVVGLAFLGALIPAGKAYRRALSHGLTIRI
jgi:putative ABC transport system permease protein